MIPNIPAKFKRIHLELTNKCNFSCSFCPDAVMRRKRGFMEQALAQKCLSEIAELNIAEKVTFHVMGEPLLHPDFFSILDYAISHGVKIGLTTNGALLTERNIEELSRRDLHQIDISLQTPDAESFSATRGAKIDFEVYTSRILKLLGKCASKVNPPIFKIRVMTTRFAKSLRGKLNIPDFMGDTKTLRNAVLNWAVLISKELKVDLDLERLKSKLNKITIYGWNVIEILPNVFFETYVLTDWGNAFASNEVIPAGFGYCFGMRDHFAILINGDVTLCCIDYEGKTVVGNVSRSSLKEVLEGPELQRIMKGFKWNRLVHEHCRKCLGSGSKAGSWVKPAASMIGLKLLKPFLYRTYKLY